MDFEGYSAPWYASRYNLKHSSKIRNFIFRIPGVYKIGHHSGDVFLLRFEWFSSLPILITPCFRLNKHLVFPFSRTYTLDPIDDLRSWAQIFQLQYDFIWYCMRFGLRGIRNHPLPVNDLAANLIQVLYHEYASRSSIHYPVWPHPYRTQLMLVTSHAAYHDIFYDLEIPWQHLRWGVLYVFGFCSVSCVFIGGVFMHLTEGDV